MEQQPRVKVSSNPEINLHELESGQKYAIVDNFLADPHSVIENFSEQINKIVFEPLGHPSRGPDMRLDEIQEIQGFMRSRLSRLFPFHRASIRLKAFFSNVALKPEELSVYHRMCHIDPRISPKHQTYAGVIYLFDNPDLGGTGFYRWKNKEIAANAFQMALKDHAAALRYLEQHSEVFRKPPEYMTSSNEIAEFITAVPAKFNRMVFYNGELPHSGHITHPELLNPDPLKGRLTLNFFAAVLPK
ncbi:MAG: DUF6445 family protein [Porticoccaceae bacterium]